MGIDSISIVVKQIVQLCADEGKLVSEMMAAFMTKTIIEGNTARYRPDGELKLEDVQVLVETAVQKLLEKDSPSVQTLKMQVGFDTAYFKQEEDLESQRTLRDREIKDLQRNVLAVKPRSSTDFEALSVLYKRIFNYLRNHHHPDDTDVDRTVEREIAAALESVFPRIGLKSFTLLSNEEKKIQLTELANIAMGIRLLNKKLKKGGLCIEDIDTETTKLLEDLTNSITKDVEHMQELCLQYQETLVYAHIQLNSGNIPKESLLVLIDRLKEELTNRRQYLSYLQSLQEDIAMSSRKTDNLIRTFNQEFEELMNLIGGRTSVPKEQVYPKFDAMARVWHHLTEENRVVQARFHIYEELFRHRDTYKQTLTNELPLFKAATDHRNGLNPLYTEQELASAAVKHGSPRAGAKGSKLEDDASDPKSNSKKILAEDKKEASAIAEDKNNEYKQAESKKEDTVYSSGAQRLSIETTPEFMQLPLEYQGFCPWTLINREGLLLPGKPVQGVVAYENAYYVFAHEVALEAFMENPKKYITGVLDLAAKRPELIHLLRIQDSFPGANISSMIRGTRATGLKGRSGIGGRDGEKKDACTETPCHFVEKYIDHNYSWNEWTLRRNAIKMTNLQNYATTSMQTDLSHFRRENTTQVYLQRDNAVQSTKESGTNPPITVTYLAGLRGMPDYSKRDKPSEYSIMRVGEKDGRPAVLNLTFEL